MANSNLFDRPGYGLADYLGQQRLNEDSQYYHTEAMRRLSTSTLERLVSNTEKTADKSTDKTLLLLEDI